MCAHGNMLKMLHALNIPHYSAKKKKKKKVTHVYGSAVLI